MPSLQTLLQIVPSLSQMVGHLAVVVVMLAFIGLGSVLGGRKRIAEFDVLTGWAVAVMAAVFGGAVLGISLALVAWTVMVCGLAGLAMSWRRDGIIVPAGTGRVLILALPLIAVTLSMVPSQWDEFSHWLHSTRYLYLVDSFPAPDLPVSKASFPAYPYALPLVGQMASTLAFRFVEPALMAFNILLLVVFALMLIRMARMGLAEKGPLHADEGAPSWGLTALGLLGATLLCPTFVPKVALTAYAETATALATAGAAIAGWLMVERLIVGDKVAARRLAMQAALLLVVVVWLKQATLALYLVVLGGVALTVLRAPNVPKMAGLAHVAVMALPALVVYRAWRFYVDANIPGKEFSLPSPADWNYDLLPTVLSGMASVATNKGGHFTLVIVIAVMGLAALWRCRTPLQRLALIAASVMVGYNVFLAVAYIAVFTDYEAKTVASFWRYNMHVGPLGSLFAFFALAILWRSRPQWRLSAKAARGLTAFGIFILAVVPLAMAGKLRFDIHPVKNYVREVGTAMNTILPADAKLVVVDPLDTGFYTLFVDYLLTDGARVIGRVSVFELDEKRISQTLGNPDITHLWVHTPHPLTDSQIGLDLAERSSHLLERRGEGWSVIHSWPYPGYALPTDIKAK